MYESDSDDEWAAKQKAKLSKADKLGAVIHSDIDYPPFRKNFYIESYEMSKMTKEEVKELRTKLDGISCRGRKVPKPIKSWNQAGLSNKIMELIRRSGFENPMPIQAQAIPIIMSGRDCIAVAKTGSGKTLAYILPMLRHIKDQPEIKNGDGPCNDGRADERVGTQIGKECRKFGKTVGVRCVSVYGGSGVQSQITDLKRGCEAVACTPGRMIDILTTGLGKSQTYGITYFVLDEAVECLIWALAITNISKHTSRSSNGYVFCDVSARDGKHRSNGVGKSNRDSSRSYLGGESDIAYR